jgi:hypothetical protein
MNYGSQSMTEPMNSMNANRKEACAKAMQDMQDRALARERMDLEKLNTVANVGNIGFQHNLAGKRYGLEKAQTEAPLGNIGFEQGHKNRLLVQQNRLTTRNIANQEAQTQNILKDFENRRESDLAKRNLEREQFEYMKKHRQMQLLQQMKQDAIANDFAQGRLNLDRMIAATNSSIQK